MLTEAMMRAGWRECPSDEVMRAWEEKGGRWQVWSTASEIPGAVLPNDWAVASVRVGAWRPVNPQTWDYDPRGWGKVVPTEPGLWWRTDRDEPVWVVVGEEGLEWYWDEAAARDKNGYPVTDEDDWIAPCVNPGVLP